MLSAIENLFDSADITRFRHALKFREGRAVEFQRRRNSFAIGNKYVAPHLPRRRSQPGRIAKSARTVLDCELLTDVLIGQRRREHTRDYLRQMTRAREQLVMRLGVHHLDARASLAP